MVLALTGKEDAALLADRRARHRVRHRARRRVRHRVVLRVLRVPLVLQVRLAQQARRWKLLFYLIRWNLLSMQ